MIFLVEAFGPDLARQARMGEIEHLLAYDKVSVEECFNVMKGQPIGVRWVDVSK